MSESGYQSKPKPRGSSDHQKKRASAPKPKRDTTYSKHAAAPPVFEFGKVAPGSQRTISLPVHNLSSSPVIGARVSYTGDPAIQLLSSPARLAAAGGRFDEGQNIKLVFNAPITRGSHHGSVTVDLVWLIGGPEPETLVIPVVAHAMYEWDRTPTEQRAHDERQAAEQQERAATAKRDRNMQRVLDRFDAEHPSFSHNRFTEAVGSLRDALSDLSRYQESGITSAHDEVFKYKKAPPHVDKSLVFELAMLFLDIASAGVAGGVAKALEGALKDVGPIMTLSTIGGRSIDATVTGAGKALDPGAPMIALLTDSVKDGLKGAGKLARKRIGGAAGPANSSRISSDIRIAFFESARNGHIATSSDRLAGATRAAARLRPTAHQDPDHAIKVIQAMTASIQGQYGFASYTYATEALRQWINLIANPKLDLNKVASVDGRGIGAVRGVIDIGFEAGASPRAPVTVRTAILRGVTNDTATRYQATRLLEAGVPVRAYGLPSRTQAELLVTVTRDAAGNIAFIDGSNGAAPGPGTWLKTKGDGDAVAGARTLMEKEIMSRALSEHGVTLTTDQDPAADREGQ